jgi:hypothetical protein
VETDSYTLERATKIPGHYTVRLDSLGSIQALDVYGFYYCDTLIEPFCLKYDFIEFRDSNVEISQDIPLNLLKEICHGSFSHGRFHRDFNIDRHLADKRYDDWLSQLYFSNNVFGLKYSGEVVGFIGIEKNSLVLHAISTKFRGKRISKFLWTPVCLNLFSQNYFEIKSSISASNIAAINLYISLGFKFRNPKDIYHKLAL